MQLSSAIIIELLTWSLFLIYFYVPNTWLTKSSKGLFWMSGWMDEWVDG